MYKAPLILYYVRVEVRQSREGSKLHNFEPIENVSYFLVTSFHIAMLVYQTYWRLRCEATMAEDWGE